MKKALALMALATVFLGYSCQQKPAEQPAQQEQKPAEQPAQQQPAQQEQKPAEQQPAGEQKPQEQPKSEAPAGAQTAAVDASKLAQAKGCFACHDINTKKVGPAFKDVAKRFAGKPGIEEELTKRIKNGGVGTWGNVPMPPQNVTDEEAKQLAQWVLSLK